jgi:hypothetical protein
MRCWLLTIGLLAFALGVSSQESPAKRALEIQRYLLKKADAANRAGRREDAILTYQAIIDHPAGDDIRAEAVLGEIRQVESSQLHFSQSIQGRP